MINKFKLKFGRHSEDTVLSPVNVLLITTGRKNFVRGKALRSNLTR
jgi:hypothetical protein